MKLETFKSLGEAKVHITHYLEFLSSSWKALVAKDGETNFMKVVMLNKTYKVTNFQDEIAFMQVFQHLSPTLKEKWMVTNRFRQPACKTPVLWGFIVMERLTGHLQRGANNANYGPALVKLLSAVAESGHLYLDLKLENIFVSGLKGRWDTTDRMVLGDWDGGWVWGPSRLKKDLPPGRLLAIMLFNFLAFEVVICGGVAGPADHAAWRYIWRELQPHLPQIATPGFYCVTQCGCNLPSCTSCVRTYLPMEALHAYLRHEPWSTSNGISPSHRRWLWRNSKSAKPWLQVLKQVLDSPFRRPGLKLTEHGNRHRGSLVISRFTLGYAWNAVPWTPESKKVRRNSIP